MPFQKVKEVLEAAHANEPNGEGKKKLAQALDMMKEREDLAKEGSEADRSDGADGGSNSLAEEDNAGGQPQAAVREKAPLPFHKMPIKDLENHVKKNSPRSDE